MKIPAASNAANHFGQLVDTAQAEPVRIQRHGRDVAIDLSPQEFHRMTKASRAKVDPTVARLHAESATRWTSVYEALAK